VSAVKYTVHAKNLPKVRDLASHFNLSERQFERKFSEYAGMSPKRFMRIVRFENACNLYRNKLEKSLTEIAYECGYFDQSHFIRDFKTFSGYEPGQYFRGHAEGTEWRD
jgi:AraC-like DNA-binding protein